MISGGSFDPDKLSSDLLAIENKLQDPEVWKDHKKLNEFNKQKTVLETKVNEFSNIETKIADIIDLVSISIELNDSDELKNQGIALTELNSEIDSLETKKYFSKENDTNNAYLDIQSGSGGTEAQDWAEMLYRMYIRWSEDMGFKVKVEEYSVGDVAGIKSASIHISGQYAYGWLRTETGIHRLVRKSPFDSGNRRHTSFAAVFVSPEIDDDIEIDLDMSQVRIDTYRASGAGGQHVNKTDSAVRITHLPTNIVVQCQSDRSQHKNRSNAMKMIKSRIYEAELQKRKENENIKNKEKKDIGWGNQIRSYILHPYKLVKDLRSGYETSNVNDVLDGKIDDFLENSLTI